MSSDKMAVSVRDLSKCYEIYTHPQDRLKQLVMPRIHKALGRQTKSYYREFWALRNLSFDIGQGETVGIIGRNGSGKSTLLQVICGTLAPTLGNVETNGRVAALLELGAGFNPEFTGRENIFMNATVLGLERKEIESRFDDITAFADIGEFIEQPLKHYSSGMYARLAFAVAINVDPRILIVDEALSVGDEPFQRKCFAKIEEIKRGGGTILFVSHSTGAILNLCDRAILLHGGQQLFTGTPKTAVGWYQKLMNAPELSEQIALEISQLDSAPEAPIDEVAETSTSSSADGNPPLLDKALSNSALGPPEQSDSSRFDPDLKSKSLLAYETNGAEILNARIESLDNQAVNLLSNGQSYKVRYQVKFQQSFDNVRFYCVLKTTTGVELGGGTFPTLNQQGVPATEHTTVDICLEFTCNLIPGVYFVNCGLANNSESLHRILDALVFRVSDTDSLFSFGVVDFHFQSTIDLSPETSETAQLEQD